MIYECDVCGYKYDEDKEGPWSDLAETWVCPVCGSDKSYFKKVAEDIKIKTGDTEIDIEIKKDVDDDYLGKWRRHEDEHESHMADIHRIAETGQTIIEPMGTRKPIIKWDDILIKGAQLAKRPVHQDEKVKTKTVIGPNAKHPLVLDTPIIISHMSFGALSKEMKIILAKGSAKVKTAIGSGEGGILEEELESAYKYVFEYIPNEYSVTDENLMKVDAIEIKFGQSSKPGMGGHLPGKKVTVEIAKVRGKPVNKDIHSPPHFPDIKSKEDLKEKVELLRKKSGGKPIGIKLAAGNIEDDLEIAVYAKPDFITIDGRAGGTGASQKFIKDSTSIPTIYALNRARKYLDQHGKDISLIITGGLRISSDFAKALAVGADAIAIGTAALMVCACQQYRLCNTGKCPVGVTTHDPELRSRLKIEKSVERLHNFLRVSTEELMDFTRLTGNDDVHKLSISDLCTTNREISEHTDISHAGG